MTPRQLHAFEWAIKQAEYGRDAVLAGYDTRQEYDLWYADMKAARSALASAWREYRSNRIGASLKAPRKLLQCVGLADRKAKG